MSHRPTLPCAAGQERQVSRLFECAARAQLLDADGMQKVAERWEDIHNYAKQFGKQAVWLQLEAYKLMWEVQLYQVQL